MKKHNQHIVSFILLFCIVIFNACVKNYKHNCENEKRYPLTEDDLQWMPSFDTLTFKVTTRNSGLHIDTVKDLYRFSYDERYETTEWCGDILYISNSIYLTIPLHDGRSLGATFHLENTRKGGGMQIYFGTDEYMNADTKLDTALVNGKIYNNVYKTRSGNYLAKGVGWIFFKNDQNETAELIPSK